MAARRSLNRLFVAPVGFTTRAEGVSNRCILKAEKTVQKEKPLRDNATAFRLNLVLLRIRHRCHITRSTGGCRMLAQVLVDVLAIDPPVYVFAAHMIANRALGRS